MRFTIDRNELLRTLGHVTSVVERRNTIPILSNVLIKAEGETISLRATDLEREVTEVVPAAVGASGSITVSAHVIHDIAKKLPDGAEIECRVDDGGRMAVRSGRSRFTLQTLPAADFPDIGAGHMPHTFEMPATDLLTLIDKTRFAVSTEEARYYLNGIYLHKGVSEGKPALCAVATDGHRLALCTMQLPSGAEAMPGVIVPRKTVNELCRMLDATEGAVTVSVSEAKIRLHRGPARLRV